MHKVDLILYIFSSSEGFLSSGYIFDADFKREGRRNRRVCSTSAVLVTKGESDPPWIHTFSYYMMKTDQQRV